MDDNSLMPWGKHKGKKLIDVPASYLLWLYENKLNFLKNEKDLELYIEDNMQVLELEIKNKNC